MANNPNIEKLTWRLVDPHRDDLFRPRITLYRLTDLCLPDCSSGIIAKFTGRCPNLIGIDANFWDYTVDQNALADFLNRCPMLERLRILGTGIKWREMESFWNLTALRKLHICVEEKHVVIDDLLARIAESFPHLEEVQIDFEGDYFSLVTNSGIVALVGLKGLHTILLSEITCEEELDASIIHLAQGGRFRRFSIGTSVMPPTLVTLVSKCPRLTWIKIDGIKLDDDTPEGAVEVIQFFGSWHDGGKRALEIQLNVERMIETWDTAGLQAIATALKELKKKMAFEIKIVQPKD